MPAAPDRTVASDGGFSELRALIASAAARHASARHQLRIVFAGRPVDVQVAGNALAERILPAFAHLAAPRTGQAPGAVSMEFVDCTECAARWPAPPDDAEWVSQGEGWRLSWHGAGRYLAEARANSLILLDRATGAVAAAFRDGSRLTHADRARPLQRMMSQVCVSFGVQDIHAALVAVDGRGVLIVGGGGRGKTTTSIDCFDSGLQFLGDDSVAIADGPNRSYLGHSLYNSARVHPVQLSRWPRLADAWQLPGPRDDKALLVPADIDPDRVAQTTPITAILVPSITDGRFRVEPTSPRHAFAALLYESQDARRFRMTEAEYRRLVDLVKTTPCFRCELARAPGCTASGIAELVGGLDP